MSDPVLTYENLVQRVGAPVVAVVFGVGQFQGLAVMRGLGRMGVPVYAIGEEKSVGFHSHYASESLVSGDPHKDPESFGKLLFGLGKKLKAEGKRAVLFPTRDSVVELLARQRDELSKFFICHTPGIEVIRNCSNKEAQVRLARRLNIPTPQTYFDDELESLHRDLSNGRLTFPLIFKAKKELPPDQLKKFRLIILQNDSQLQDALTAARSEKISFLIQEIIPGEDDTLYTLGSCLSQGGELKAVFTGRKLRQRPPRFGEARVSESIRVEEIVRHGGKLLRALNFFGISQVEFKFDSRDGQYKLMEVNPRSWSWISLPIAMGINIPFAFLCDACRVDCPMQPMPSQRAVYISLRDDLYWSLKARDGFPWVHCFRGYEKIVEPYYAKDDRKPGLIHFKRTAIELSRAFAGSLLRKIGLKRNRQMP